MFKALSEGHRAFRRIAVVADTDGADAALRRLPADPVGVLPATSRSCSPTCTEVTGRHRMSELLPHPFDGRCST